MAIDTLGANALASNSVTTAKIAADAVTSAKIPAGAVVASDVADGSVTTAKLADTVAFGRRNIVINGAMQVAQRSTGTVTVADSSNEGYSTLDRFMINMNNAVGGAVDMSQSSDAPVGFANSVKLKCQTTNTDYTGTKQVELRHKIEASNLQHLCFGTSSAKSITISWYMKTVNYTGPITLGVQTHDGTNEYYVKSVTPTTSWARYTCTIPGSTTATINNDNGLGMSIDFVLAGASGGTYAASSDSTGFSTTRVDYRNNIGNLLSNTSNEIYITGVQMEVGDTATPFEHRSFGEELAACQRYYNRIGFYNQRVRIENRSSQNPDMTNTITFPTMRDAPTMNTYTDSAYTTSGTTVSGGATLSFGNISSSSANASLNSNTAGAGTIAGACYLELSTEI